MTIQDELFKHNADPYISIRVSWKKLDTTGPTLTTEPGYYSHKRPFTWNGTPYQARILSMGPAKRSGSLYEGGPPRNRFLFSLDNSDRYFSELLTPTGGGTVFIKPTTSSVTLQVWHETGSAFPAGLTIFSGAIRKWSFQGDTLQLEVDDAFTILPDLTRDFPITYGTAGNELLTDILLDAWYTAILGGLQIPWNFGEHNALNTLASMQNKGVYFDRGSWMNPSPAGQDVVNVGFMRAAQVNQFWRNFPSLSVQDALVTGWTELNAYNGTFNPVIFYNGTTHPLTPRYVQKNFAPSETTAGGQDRYSYDTAALGGQTWPSNGDPVSDYVYDLIRGIIEDLCGIDFFDVAEAGSEWTTFQAACQAAGLYAGGRVTERQSPFALINEICQEFDISYAINRGGKIFFFLEDSQYTGNPIRNYSDIKDVLRGSLKYYLREDTVINQVSSAYRFAEPGGIFLNNSDVLGGGARIVTNDTTSQTLYGIKEKRIDHKWATQLAVVQSIASRIISKRAYGDKYIEFETGLSALLLEPFDLIGFQHNELPDDGQVYVDGERIVAVQSVQFNPTRRSFTVVCRDITELAT